MTVDAGDIRTWRTTVILTTGKTRRPQFEPHAGIKMAQAYPKDLVDLYSNGLQLVKMKEKKKKKKRVFSHAPAIKFIG